MVWIGVFIFLHNFNYSYLKIYELHGLEALQFISQWQFSYQLLEETKNSNHYVFKHAEPRVPLRNKCTDIINTALMTSMPPIRTYFLNIFCTVLILIFIKVYSCLVDFFTHFLTPLFKTLEEETEKYPAKWKEPHTFDDGFGRINTVKLTFLLKTTSRFNAIQIKIPVPFLHRNWKRNLYIHLEPQHNQCHTE